MEFHDSTGLKENLNLNTDELSLSVRDASATDSDDESYEFVTYPFFALRKFTAPQTFVFLTCAVCTSVPVLIHDR